MKKSDECFSSVKTCLLIHDNNKLGDLIVLSSLYRELEVRGIKLSILTSEAGKEFLTGNPKIHRFFIKKSNRFNDIMALASELRACHFDMVLDPFETMPSFHHSLVLFTINTKFILGFDKWYKRYYTYYHPHDENLESHMCTRAYEILSFMFGKMEKDFNINYDLPLPTKIENDILEFIGNSNVIIINALGAKKICRLTREQIELIYYHVREVLPEYRVIFTGLPSDLKTITVPDIEKLPFNSFMHTVALTKFSRYVITVDTALVHIASAYKIATLALYPHAQHPSYPSHLIWSPNNTNALQVVSSTSSVKDIEPSVIINSLNILFNQKWA